jgi:hypothetical protein
MHKTLRKKVNFALMQKMMKESARKKNIEMFFMFYAFSHSKHKREVCALENDVREEEKIFQ